MSSLLTKSHNLQAAPNKIHQANCEVKESLSMSKQRNPTWWWNKVDFISIFIRSHEKLVTQSSSIAFNKSIGKGVLFFKTK